MSAKIADIVEEVYRNESRRIFASLVRILGDFDLAESSLHEAFAAALEQWTKGGVPSNPRAWLVSTGRFKAIDVLRRRKRFESSLGEQIDRAERVEMADLDDARFKDDHLRLVFTCCHPALSPHTRVALTLREVCGLTTEEIASAFLSAPSTIAQRIVRGKEKIRHSGIPYAVPSPGELPERVESVLSVTYLVFNEGYSASSGSTLIRPDLSAEAIRLGRLLLELVPTSEVAGLLALMLLTDSRRASRVTADGDIVLLEDQDRSLWDRASIDEGLALLRRAGADGPAGPYTSQAAIAAVHARARSAPETDWSEIVSLYDALFALTRSPVVELNRAVAIAMRDGPRAGLVLIADIVARGEIGDYHLLHAARADLHRRLGEMADARAAYSRALELAKQEPERRFLAKRLKSLE